MLSHLKMAFVIYLWTGVILRVYFIVFPLGMATFLPFFYTIFGPFCMWIHTHVSACSQKCACFACCRIPNTLPKPWYQFTETWQALTRGLLCLAQFSAAGWPRENQLPITGNSLSATLESLHFLWIDVILSHQNFYQSVSFFHHPLTLNTLGKSRKGNLELPKTRPGENSPNSK